METAGRLRDRSVVCARRQLRRQLAEQWLPAPWLEAVRESLFMRLHMPVCQKLMLLFGDAMESYGAITPIPCSHSIATFAMSGPTQGLHTRSHHAISPF